VPNPNWIDAIIEAIQEFAADFGIVIVRNDKISMEILRILLGVFILMLVALNIKALLPTQNIAQSLGRSLELVISIALSLWLFGAFGRKSQ
jgi:hypothetical protein